MSSRYSLGGEVHPEPALELTEVAIELDGEDTMSRRSMSFRSDCDEANSHRLLRGGRPPYPHSYSRRQMEVLTAVCDTILPSIDFDLYKRRTVPEPPLAAEESLRTFFATSASMAGTPQHIAGFISERMKHPLLGLLRMALFLLSTWYGTFICCGWLSVGTEFPYFRKFSDIELHRREAILRSWSSSYFTILRQLFNALKFLTLLTFFTQVDQKNENPSWAALGYCGPDPEFANRKKRPDHRQGKDGDGAEYGPLHGAVIDMESAEDGDIAASLRNSGFSVTIHRRTRSGKTVANIMKKLKGRGGECDDVDPAVTIRCDAVVVGSGSGGGVVAGEIAKAGYKVIVLEKGRYYARKTLSLLEGPTIDQMYEGGGVVATDDLGILVLAGSTVGGGSAINWSASIRTPEHVRKEWSEKNGLELFGSEAYTEALDSVCDRMGVQAKPLRLEEESLNSSVVRKGCLELGYPVSDIPRNSPSDHSCGWCCFGCKDGKKKGTQETWLVDAVESGNGAIISGARALKIVGVKQKNRARKKAAGILFQRANKEKDVVYFIESKVTIVACGALNTPVLLRKSGLRNPHIGRNLKLHPVQMAWGYFPEAETNNRSYEGGIMTAMSTVAANFSTTGYGAIIQTPALHPGMFSVLVPWVSGLDSKERMSRFSRTAHVFALARDRGSGVVDLPRSLSYQLAKEDEESLGNGLEKVLRILAAAGAEEIGTHHVGGERINVKRASYNEFERFVARAKERGVRGLSTPLCSAHQMGSCRMGVNPEESVVDERGESWEVEGLYLADASVLPGALGVNPMVTIMAVAHCTSKVVVDVLKRKKRTQ
ncbi:long-chain-alcohol oxidase FAO4A [Nymphaea colorata]|nr:long-chain-alcohol oxidase FAO4A [Nymphaea colorata]